MMLTRAIRTALLIVATPLLVSCGFTPVYGNVNNIENVNIATYLAAVKIHKIKGATGQLLASALEDRLNPTSSPGVYGEAFELDITLTHKRDSVIVEPDGSISRYNIKLNSKFILQDAETKEELLTGNISRIASYNVAEEKFAAYVAEQAAVKRAVYELSEDYKQRLAGFFIQNYRTGKRIK